MAHKVELPPPWWERRWVWGMLAVAVLTVGSVLRDASTPAPASVLSAGPVASVAVPEITLSCGGDKEYRPLPDVKSFVVIIEPTGKNCWTPWLRRPGKARNVQTDPDGDIESEMAFGEGKIVQRHDSPLISGFDPQVMNAVRYQNQTPDAFRLDGFYFADPASSCRSRSSTCSFSGRSLFWMTSHRMPKSTSK